MPIRQVRSSRPVPTAASWCGCAMMPTSPLIVSIAIAHGPTPAGVASENRNGSSDASDDAPAKGNQHEGQHDDEHALKEIGPCSRHETADEAVEDEQHGHDD